MDTTSGKHIVHITPVFRPYKSGMTNVVYQQARQLVLRGYTVTVITPLYSNDIAAEEVYDGILVKRVKPVLKLGNGAFVPGLKNVLEQLNGVDIIHLHTPFFGGAEVIWALAIRNKLPAPLIVQYHHDAQLQLFTKILGFTSKLTFKSLIKKADIIIGSSTDYLHNCEIASSFDDRFKEVAIGVDTKRFSPLGHKQIPLFEGYEVIRFLFLGVLDKAHHFKGVDILLQAIARMKQERDSRIGPKEQRRLDLKLTVAGQGDMLEYYTNLSQQLRIDEYVEFIGYVKNEDLPDVFKEADVFVFPSTGKAEAFGLVALEAMSSGLPVIASALPGVRTLFNDTQLLIEPGSVTDLVDKLEYVLANKEKLSSIGDMNRDRAKQQYSIEKVTSDLENVYNELINKNLHDITT